jgi:hypothetical protein
MAYYLDLFSPETYEAFGNSSKTISGFRMRQLNAAKGIHPGDKLICYMTKLSRWFGVLEVATWPAPILSANYDEIATMPVCSARNCAGVLYPKLECGRFSL